MVSSIRLYNVRRLLNLTREPTPKMNQVSQDRTLLLPKLADIDVGSEWSPQDIRLFKTWFYKQAIAQALDPEIELEIEIDPIFNEGIDLFEEVLSHARDYVAAWGGELIVVYLPDYMRYDVEEPVTEEAMYRLEILPVIEALDIPMVDLHQTFSAYPEPASFFPFQMQGHYNEDGYTVVAQEVLKFLEQKNMDKNMNQGENR